MEQIGIVKSAIICGNPKCDAVYDPKTLTDKDFVIKEGYNNIVEHPKKIKLLCWTCPKCGEEHIWQNCPSIKYIQLNNGNTITINW